MQQWEHMKVTEAYFEENRKMVGADGWEMCGIAYHGGSMASRPCRFFWFKRPIQPPI